VLADLEVGALSRIMRPTTLMAGIVGVVAVGIALLLGSPHAGLGIILGVVAAVWNVRMLAGGVTKVETDGSTDNKVVRKILRTRSALRLGLITLVAIGLLLVDPALGLGMVIGLVIFQISFVVNAGRAILSAGVG
jgi:ATP synthase I chain